MQKEFKIKCEGDFMRKADELVIIIDCHEGGHTDSVKVVAIHNPPASSDDPE